MDTSFNCPKCNLHITADECVVGEEIDCPECGEKFRVPPPAKPKLVPVVVKSATPAAHAAPVLHAAPAHPAAAHPAAGHATPAHPVPAHEAAKAAGAAEPPKPEAKPAAHAPEHKPFVVPQRSGPQESLVKKTVHAEDKHEEKKIRVKTIKRGSCVEVGHDLFDEKVTEFLNKVGRENIINVNAISYGAMDSTGHMLPDYGIMIVYNG